MSASSSPQAHYCATCRGYFEAPDGNPPYGAVHVSKSQHLHPLTRTPLAAVAPVAVETGPGEGSA